MEDEKGHEGPITSDKVPFWEQVRRSGFSSQGNVNKELKSRIDSVIKQLKPKKK